MIVHINNKTFQAEFLSSPEDIRKGMMGRDSLDGSMVFKMGKGFHSFWLKNCLINLDIVFVLNGRINKIHLNCEAPSPNTMKPPTYTGIGDYVIEFPANTATKWKIGDRVSFQD